FIMGLGAAFFAGTGAFMVALGLFILNRIFDGLAESAGRAGGITGFGRYLDIVLNFIVYSAIALSFAFIGDGNSLISAILMFSLLAWGGSILAFAGVARGLHLQKNASGNFLLDLGAGLVGTTEITLGLILLLLVPEFFPAIGILLAGLILLSTIFRIFKARLIFQE
ncbi:MAG: hypothetical protein V3R64_07890, partial [Sphingomonadales bacterium]